MAPLAVDPEALYAAGSAVAAAGGGLAANLTVLAAGFSAHTGVDRAGEVFGLGYQDAAKSLLKAAAAAVNACLKCGALIQQGASNYSKAEVASTLGRAGGVLEAPSSPTEVAAPGPPGTMGPGEPPPLLWSIVESLVLESWPDGDVAGLRAAASRWRDFAAAAKGVQRALNASKALLDTQHLPEGDKIDTALNEIGSAAATIGESCQELATKIDTFAAKVDHAQQAIRDLLHRLGSLGDLGHDIMLIIDGDAWDEIKKIAKDINDVLGHLGREARACEQGIRLLMQAGDREIMTCEKYARRGLTQFLGDDVGNPVATAFDTWINAHEGVFKGAVDMGLGLADLSPHWFFVDPQGAAATWTGLGKSAWKGSLFNAPLHPKEFADAKLQELKGLVHAEDWSRARPGLGAGENLFDVATLFVPGAGEAGAAADGAGAAARGAEAEVEAAGAAGRAGGIAGARDALTGISKATADLPKNLEGVTKDLPEVKPPTSGTPVAFVQGKPIEPPVESPPRPADGAPGTPHTSGPPTEAPRPVAAGGPSDLATAPPSTPAVHSGPHDPVSVPAEVPHEPVGGRHEGPHEPPSAPPEVPRERESVPAEVPRATGERVPWALPQAFDHSAPWSPSSSPGEAVPFAAHSPAAMSPAAPHVAPPIGRPVEIPTTGGGWQGGPPGGHMPGELPHEAKPHGEGVGDGGPTIDRPDGKSPDRDDPAGHGRGHGGERQDPVHSHEPSGDGWHRLADEAHDANYGEPLSDHWDFTDNPVDATKTDSDVAKLIRDPEAPFGRDPQGHAYEEGQYAERFNKPGDQGQPWLHFPGNHGAVPHTRVAYTDAASYLRDYGCLLDRIGKLDGKYLAVMEDGQPASWEERALHVNSLRDPYNAYTFGQLPDGWTIEVSETAPAVGQPGGSIQVRVFDEAGGARRVVELIRRGVLRK